MQYPKGTKGAVDRLFSEVIRSIGYCENCFRKPPLVQLQCAHIISRRYANTRADLRNAFSLCAACHRFYTDHPVEFAKFVQRSWANEYYDATRIKSQKDSKVDWSLVQRHIKEVKQHLNAGRHTLEDLRRVEAKWYNEKTLTS